MPGFQEPFFHQGRLVQHDAIPKFRVKEMAQGWAWLPVKSSNVKAICWRAPGSGEHVGLLVWFDPEGGEESMYSYPDATWSDYTAMRDSPSKGRFVHERLRGMRSIGPLKPAA